MRHRAPGTPCLPTPNHIGAVAPKYPQAGFDRALAECKADPTWQVHVNETTGHDVMVDQPQWLAELLLKVA